MAKSSRTSSSTRAARPTRWCATSARSGWASTPTDSIALSYDLLPPCPAADSIATCTHTLLAACPDRLRRFDSGRHTSNGLVSSIGISELQFSVAEPKSSYTYQLSATPAAGASTSQTNLGNPATGSSCGFALPGTGTFSSTMCFVGFTTAELQAAYPNAGKTCTTTDPGQQGLDMSVDVPGGYVMSFCLTVVPGAGENQNATNPPPVVAVSTPIGGGTCTPVLQTPNPNCRIANQTDYGYESNGQGFLGNDNQVNGVATPFYAGIGCPVSTPLLQNNIVSSSCIDPAIFQTTNAGNDTVTLSNIQVVDPDGDVATGYEVITADAETVDPGSQLGTPPTAYIKWTSSLPASRPLPFNLVPNFTGSDLGNACNRVPPADTSPAGNATGWSIDNGDTTVQIGGTDYTGYLSGLGTDFVECQSNWQTSAPYLRTGTAMLGISPPTVNGGAEPVTIKAQLQGEGYNAVAFGLLLP